MKSNRKIEATHERTIAIDVAKFFKILSAYFIAAETSKPPSACNIITIQTNQLYPKKNPPWKIRLLSTEKEVAKDIGTESILN